MGPDQLAEMTGKDPTLSGRVLEELRRRYDISKHLRVQPYSLERKLTANG